VRRLCPGRFAGDPNLAGVGLEQAVHDLEQRRLAGARLAYDRDELPGWHGEIDRTHGRALAIRKPDARELDQRRGVGVSRLAQRS
jgi:hypothetical protein